MGSKGRKRDRSPSSKTAPKKAKKKHVLDTAVKAARRVQTRKASSNDSKRFNKCDWDPAKSDMAIRRCENLIHKLSAEVENLKSLIKPVKKFAKISNRNKPDIDSDDRESCTDDSEGEEETLEADDSSDEESDIEGGKTEENVQDTRGWRLEEFKNRKARREPDSEDDNFKNEDDNLKSEDDKFSFIVQKGTSVYLNGGFKPLKEILSSGHWIFVTHCCERDDALDGKSFMESWTNFAWPGTPPTVLCACEVGKGVAVLVRTRKDMRKACDFEAEVMQHKDRELHEMRAAKFHGPNGLPLVFRLNQPASEAHDYIMSQLHEEFPSSHFDLYQMLEHNGVIQENQFFVVFSEAPTHIVKRIYFRGLPSHKGRTRGVDLVVDNTCYSCNSATPHTESKPCDYWVYLWTSVGGKCFRGKALAELWLAEGKSAEEKTVRPLNLEWLHKPATACPPSNSSMTQARNAESHELLDTPGLSKPVPWSFGTIQADKAKNHGQVRAGFSFGAIPEESARGHHDRTDTNLFSFRQSQSSDNSEHLKNNEGRAATVFGVARDLDSHGRFGF